MRQDVADGDESIRLTVLSAGHERVLHVPLDASESDDVKLRNVHEAQVLGAEESDVDVQDLINLPHLHEPAILHSLHQRFLRGDIYETQK